MKKRLLSLALALVLCIGLVTPAFAAGQPGTVGKPAILAAGEDTIAVISSKDTLWMWGLKDHGMMGVGETQDYEDNAQRYQETPVKVMENVRSVSISSSDVQPFAAAIKTDGSLWMWGCNNQGQLGNGGTGSKYDSKNNWTVQSTPVKIMDNVVAVSCGTSHTAAIKADGSLWVWGNNNCGTIGNGEVGNQQKTPVKVLDNVSSVLCYGSNTAAVKTDGTLWMWGDTSGNAFNNGGIGNYTESFQHLTSTLQTVPIKVMEGVETAYCGYNGNPLVLKKDGTLVTWPTNAGMKEVSQGDYAAETIPIQPTEPMPLETVMKDVAYVSGGTVFAYYHGITQAILKKDGSLWMSGNNRYGQLGVRELFQTDEISHNNPVKVMDNVVAVAVYGSSGVAAVTSDGKLWGWGYQDSALLKADPMSQVFPGSRKSWTNVLNQKIPVTCIDTPYWISPINAKIPVSDSTSTSVPTIGGFNDVKSTDYFADAVLWAVEKNITSGTSKTTFSPNATCTKAQILTFLWRANGSPEPTISNPFTDIKAADYYYKAALWAAEKGLVSGSTFGANADCTRAMTVEYLWKAAGSPAPSGKASFTDVSANADYAQAVAWAVEKGITSGTSKTTFSPAATCTRGQIVTFLYRAMQ